MSRNVQGVSVTDTTIHLIKYLSQKIIIRNTCFLNQIIKHSQYIPTRYILQTKIETDCKNEILTKDKYKHLINLPSEQV